MKKALHYILCVTVLLLLAGCQGNTAPADGSDGSWLLGVEPEYVSEWPENEFTECIPKPEHGELDYICDYSEHGRYQVVIKEIEMSESEEYVDTLLSMGYAELVSDGNNVSVGRMLQRDNVTLSVSYSDGVLGILITISEKRE